MRILVCDDHALLAEALAVRLRARGHTTIVVSSPEEGARSAAVEPPDLCLVDLRFPDRPLAGLEVIPELRRVAPRAAVLLLSGALTGEIAAAALAAGAHGVAGKDIALPALERAVDQIARGRVVAAGTFVGSSSRSSLTCREQEVIDLVAAGRSNGVIAGELGISVTTVRGHVAAALTKLDVHSRLDAATVAGRTLPRAAAR